MHMPGGHQKYVKYQVSIIDGCQTQMPNLKYQTFDKWESSPMRRIYASKCVFVLVQQVNIQNVPPWL